MKKIFLLTIVTLLCNNAFAYWFYTAAPSGQTLFFDSCGGGVCVTYEFSEDLPYWVCPKPTGNLTIPDSVSYSGQVYAVKAIGYYSFSTCNGLTSVTIPNTVTSIGMNAFEGCSGLSSITIPNSITSIGIFAFHGCSGLTSVNIPDSVTSIQSSVFYGCRGLTNITIPNSVTSIGDNAFNSCSGLTNVSIPNSVTTIEGGLFSGCSGLTNVSIPNSITSIGGGAFGGCSSLTSVVIPNSVTAIGHGAFQNCSGLASILLPNSLTRIEGNTFFGCSGLTTIAIPDSITFIGNYAFYDCSGLVSVTIPNTVTTIGEDAFRQCSGLTTVILGNSVASIGNEAFKDCCGLTSITIPSSVITIGNNAFQDCVGLTTMNFNAYSCSIAGTSSNPAFNGCTNISIVNFGDGVTIIPQYLCQGLSGLIHVTIPFSVTNIGNSAFSGCEGLTTLNFDAKRCLNAGNIGCTNVTTVNFGDSVELIPSGLCQGFGVLNTITIPNSVSTIGNSAFNGCGRLTTINYNARNCSIESRYSSNNRIFHGCNNLSKVNFGDSVIIIPAYLLHHCVGLDSVTIGNSVTIIGDSAFLGCTGLANINYTGTIAQWCGISFGIASNPIQYTHNLCVNDIEVTNLVIPQGISEIKPRAFMGCGSLTSVEVPNSAISIGLSAFSGCDHITNIILGTGLSVIENNAFWGCTQVVRIISKATIPPIVQSSTFSSLSDDVILNVPCDAANAYENAAYWFRFNIQEDLMYEFSATSSNPARGTVTIVTEPTCDYSEAQVQANAYHGYHFDHWNDGNTDNPRYIVVLQDTHLVAYFASDNGEDEGVEEVVENKFKCYQQNGQIVVEGAEGNNVMVYDLYGRVLAIKRDEGTLLRFDVPATGTYLIRIGDAPARRIVVVR